jgi:hypothetical protein
MIAGLVLFSVIMAVTTAVPGAGLEDPAWRKHVTMGCHSSECLSPRQFVSSNQAMWMRRDTRALVVDIGEAIEPSATRAGVRPDARIPFTEHGEFRIPFGNEVDDALRGAGLGHEQPVLLVSRSAELSILAALLLQERGYSRILVVVD